MASLSTLIIVFSLSYTLALFLHSRRRRPRAMAAPERLFFVFIIPCLNEELVIGRSLERLLSLPGDNFAVLVVDDGSDDGTAEIVKQHDPRRVWLLRRQPPNARLGKGKALNAAFQHIVSSDLIVGRRPEDVVVAVLDADGRLAPNALYEVAPFFRDPKVGAVQIGVRMYNAGERMLTRLQDFEFVTFMDVPARQASRIRGPQRRSHRESTNRGGPQGAGVPGSAEPAIRCPNAESSSALSTSSWHMALATALPLCRG